MWHGIPANLSLGPDADLHELAYTALADADLDTSLANLAVETVKSVAGSAIWLRARSSPQCLVEVPFEMVLPVAGHDKPTLVRGVIDLIFLEPAGWVIVDYKTDAVLPENHAELAEHYRGQLEIYAEAWKKVVGPVQERGLYFTRTAQYVKV